MIGKVNYVTNICASKYLTESIQFDRNSTKVLEGHTPISILSVCDTPPLADLHMNGNPWQRNSFNS